MSIAAIRPTSTLGSYLTAAGELPAEALLGHLSWWQIDDAPYVLDELRAHFTDLGLDPAHLPLPVKPVDAFRRATTEATGEKLSYLRGQRQVPVTAEILIRDVELTKAVFTRAIVREIRDGANQRLSYEVLGKITYFRPTISRGVTRIGSERVRVQLDHDKIEAEEMDWVRATTDAILARYDSYRAHVDGNRVRATVRSYLLSMNALCIRPGLYFVHIGKQDTYERLTAFIQRIGNQAHLAPLVDLASQRAMVIERFQVEAEEALNDVVNAITHLRASRQNITGEAYAKIRAQYDDVISRAKEYQAMLNITQDRTGAAAEVAVMSLHALAKQMEAPAA